MKRNIQFYEVQFPLDYLKYHFARQVLWREYICKLMKRQKGGDKE
jgi:hypothetical protein